MYGVAATNPEGAGYESVLSQLLAAIIGKGAFYWVTIGSILLVLSLSANTAFADFPRLARAIAQNGYLPHSLALRGSRLVYLAGRVRAGVAGAVLLTIFGGRDGSPDSSLRGRRVSGVHVVAGGHGGALAQGRRPGLAAQHVRQRAGRGGHRRLPWWSC